MDNMPQSLVPIRFGRLCTQAKAKPLESEIHLLWLPDELLLEIARELLWRDILSLRQTCKRLWDITKSSDIWRSLVCRESRQTLWLELPVESYTSEELERLLLRRKSAEARYEAAAKDVVLPQWILPVDIDISLDCAWLIPGGRWFLISTSRGSVNYYDLHSEDHLGRELIPERYDERRSSICIDVDSNSPILTFNLALANSDYMTGDRQATLEIWQVSLVVDEEGKGVALKAQSLADFLQEPMGPITSMALVGTHFAYSVHFDPHERTYIFIVNWKTIHESNYPKQVVVVPPNAACCLFDGNICVPDCGTLRLLSITSLPTFTTMPRLSNQIPRPEHLTSIALPKTISLCTSSYPVSHQGVTHILIGTGTAIYDVFVKDTESGPELDAIRLADISAPLVGVRISVSDNFCLPWVRREGQMFLQRLWTPGDISDYPPLLLPYTLAKAPYFYSLDMASGQIVTYENECFQISLLRLL
ncbi:hypothetical protein BDN72DRAFT_260594 [Pluteus cervinus]|uniref:Uncharacterized protein n=1 Tax=Pluteus cervinus TaxID=181527 RepID=A0ACD3AFE3_9AGAR|nr:hypothetical protein BDN72DRAFT_260594 [Pluteus cervinus]